MNFFEQQEASRRRTRHLVVAFIFAVIGTIIAVDLALLLAFGLSGAAASLAAGHSLTEFLPLLAGGAVVTTLVITVASLYRIASLSEGGGVVARSLGGVPVDADVQDPLRHRLRNVVEEMALASGVTVPEIYVLEQEEGINAFAAGFTPADAAIAVTRGALERLDRAELQGVVAHEMSHILNGDMRLNIRLMGALYGILVLAIAGRRVLSGMRFSSDGSRRNGGGIAIFAFALMAVGYAGLFFGRWIKASVSRQREFLADASAVQFTRHPEGIGGALKKIAASARGTLMTADSEEISHMLFGQGTSSRMFATHPPIEERIRRIDPSFDPGELEALAKTMPMPRWAEEADRGIKSRPAVETVSAAAGSTGPTVAAEAIPPAAAVTSPLDVNRLIASIGRPNWDRVRAAAELSASLPRRLVTAARSPEWAPEALLRVLLDQDAGVRETQLLAVARHLGHDSETQVRFLVGAIPGIAPTQRLYLLELAFPALRRRPRAYLERFITALNELSTADGKIDAFEYLLGKLVTQHLKDALAPRQAAVAGHDSLEHKVHAVSTLLAVLAAHGHDTFEGSRQAYQNGMATVGVDTAPTYPEAGIDLAALDNALTSLNSLRPTDKERLLRGMFETVLADGDVRMTELELLRAACAVLHLPLPLW